MARSRRHRPSALRRSYFAVTSDRPSYAAAEEAGALGQSWFAGRLWIFDYPAQRLIWRAPGELPAHARTEEVPLQLPADDGEDSPIYIPLVPVVVDGESFKLILDTGATMDLTEQGLTAIGDGGPRVRAGSFVQLEVFNRWRRAHPDWRVVWDANQVPPQWVEPIIQVPRVTVGGHDVGPVWFSGRTAPQGRDHFAGGSDLASQGSLGGNVLQHFRVTVDYPGRRAIFQQP